MLAIIREIVIKKAIQACIYAYNDIIFSNDSKVGEKLLEDYRRNQIYCFIEKNKRKYDFDYIITTESGTIDSNYKTAGRIDICVFYSPSKFEQEYFSLECKRFVKDNSSFKATEEAYYHEGIQRYEIGKYKCDSKFGGMIAFCEEGCFDKLKDTISKVLKCHSLDGVYEESDDFNHKYVHSIFINDANNQKIKIISIMMNFS